MQCPYCQGVSSVVDSRAVESGVRRRRVCGQCRRRFTTYEKRAAPNIKVIKRSRKTEAFDPEKLGGVLRRISSGRPAGLQAEIARVAEAIEAELLDQNVKKIESRVIIERALARVAEIDALAYNRLAADYLDESGRLRTAQPTPLDDSDQLDLFESDGDDDDR